MQARAALAFDVRRGTVLEHLMENLSGVDGDLPPSWNSACEQWIKTIEQLCANFAHKDAPWEYLERTNSAIFAGALTAAGVPAMPEAYVNRNNERRDHRVDICAVASNSIDLIEFKIAGYDAAKYKTVNRTRSRMKDATRQVNNITGIFGNPFDDTSQVLRTGAVIGLPCFDLGTSETTINEIIQQIIVDLRRSSFPIKAWIFPSQYVTKPSRRYSKYYPGTFLVAQRL